MSEVTRDGFKKLSYLLGEAQNNIIKNIGDLNKSPNTLMGLEAILAKSRGSTLFFNEDYSTAKYPAPSDPSVIENFDFVKFPTSDALLFGLQGAYLTKDYDATINDNLGTFPPLGAAVWNPSYEGPPSTEGFGTWYYNAWKNYNVDPPALPGFEGGNYNLRFESNYPVRYVASPTPYSRVAFFEHARWISILNSDVSARGSNDAVYVFEIDKNDLYGLKVKDPETDLPVDLRFMYYNKLLQKHSSNWEEINVVTNSNLQLNYLAYEIEDNGDTYLIRINIPNDLTFDPDVGVGGFDHMPDTWWHFVMYWGSNDTKVTEDIVAFDDTPPNYVLSTNEYLIWNVKHFFDNKINSKLTWTNHAINDSEEYSLTGINYRYLIANNRLHYEVQDGTESVLISSNPYKYRLLDSFLYSTSGSSINSISNVATDLKNHEFQSAILMCKTYGSGDIGSTEFLIKLGPKFSHNESRYDWENFKYYPEPDLDYLTFAKLIIKRANVNNYGSIEKNYVNGIASNIFDLLQNNKITILQNVQIIWCEQVPPSFAVKPMGDPLIAQFLVPSLHKNLVSMRFQRKDLPILTLAAKLLIIASDTPQVIANNSNSLIDPNGKASIIFRKLLKNPVNPLLQPDTDESLAFQFDTNEIKLIESISSKPPSTEMLRLDADKFYLIDNKINIANTFEIFQEPSDQCTAADNQTSGNSVGLDYTLRLVLEDQNENSFLKDWHIMASKYLLTKEEYNKRIEKEQTTVGYFTLDTLENISEWRLQGYASIVPDLSMGASRVLTTRFISPPDSTQETEAQFRAKYEAQGRSQSEIDELVLRYLEAGGEFYEVNLSKFDNLFTKVRSAALNITTFTEAIPYWQSNISDFYKINLPDPDEPVEGFYADSFTLSLEGASIEDLEAYGKLSNTIYSFEPSSSIVNLTLHNNQTAFKFNSGLGGRVSNVIMKLKSDLFDTDTLILTNNGSIYAYLFSSNNDLPYEQLAKSNNSVKFQDLDSTDYLEFEWKIEYSLSASTNYWIVLELNSTPQGGDILVATQTPYNLTARKQEFQAFSFISIADTNIFNCGIPLKVLVSDTNTTNKLTNTSGYIDIKIYSSDTDGNIYEPITFTSVNNTINFEDLEAYEIIFNFDASSISLSKNTKYWILLTLSERPRGGTISANLNSIYLNEAEYLNTFDNGSYSIWDNWDENNYKAWLKVAKIIPEIYGYFNRDEEFDLKKYLPSANTNRITNALLNKEGSWSFTIKKFPEPSIVYIYPRYVDGNYVSSFRDIYVVIRLMVGGQPKDYYVHIDPNTNPVEPIAINDVTEKADSIAYMYVAKSLSELQNGYHGAPPSDRLVIRSS